MKFLIKLFATGFGTGYIPIAPGTFATFFAAGIWMFLPEDIFFVVFILFLLTAIIVCGKAENLFGIKDDQRIVIDEIVGYFFTVIFLPKTLFILILSIVLFRFLDIKKPFYINSVQKLKGGLGILADDVLSGIAANLIILITIRILSF